MPVTELAQLRLKTTTVTDESLRRDLLAAKKAMESFSCNGFSYYLQESDHGLLYVIGCWKSVQQHLEDWIPSTANQNLLELLKDKIAVEWMFHIDMDINIFPMADKITISRYVVAPSQRDAFSKSLGELQNKTRHHTAPIEFAGGWKLERAGTDQDEWVQFSCGNIAQSLGEECKPSSEMLMSRDVKHMVRLDL